MRYSYNSQTWWKQYCVWWMWSSCSPRGCEAVRCQLLNAVQIVNIITASSIICGEGWETVAQKMRNISISNTYDYLFKVSDNRHELCSYNVNTDLLLFICRKKNMKTKRDNMKIYNNDLINNINNRKKQFVWNFM